MCGYVPGAGGAGIHDARIDAWPPPEVLSSAPSERVLDAPEIGAHALLAIDTALGTSVALGSGGRIFEVSSDNARGHTEAIGRLIARALELAGASPQSVTGVVAGIGPGPFTGLRVGIAAAHAFAVGRSVPLLPLLSHEAVALAALGRGATSAVRVVQDARRRELFVTDFAGLDWMGAPLRHGEPRLEHRESFAAGPGDLWPERIPAARLVQLAARRLASGREFEPDRALYLRDPDVYPPAARKRVSS